MSAKSLKCTCEEFILWKRCRRYAEDLAGKKYQDKEIFNILRSPNGELKTVTS